MKKVLSIILFMVITFPLWAQSSDREKEQKFSIQISPLLFAVDIMMLSIPKNEGEYAFLVGVEFQYVLNEYVTFSIEPRFGKNKNLAFGYGYGSIGTFLDGFNNQDNAHFTLNPGLLFNPFGTGLKGWYLGIYPTVGWRNVLGNSYSKDSPNVNDNFFILGITGGSGYQWVQKNGFTIALGAAFGKTWDIASKNNTGVYDDSSNLLFDFILNFKLGYSF